MAVTITKEIYHSLGLSDEEYQKILDILGRQPSLTEIAMFSVEWSEHCGYPRSRNWLKLLPREGKFETLVGEDSGGVIIDDFAVIFKMESHNHPSFVEPRQGAATGIGGIIRDIFTTGARPIACLNSLRFGPLSERYNRYLLTGVVDGIQFYGNCLGVPTVGGEIYFDACYSGNCLVNVMGVGLAKKESLARAIASGAGNSILYVGSSTGKDGIGGCSVLASHEFKEGEEKRPTVQIGDPFAEKCLIEATLQAIETGFVVGIKDMGAAGLTCSTTEMANAGGCGMEVELQLVPRREENMEPWEIMMSESQERMLVCVEKGREDDVRDIFERWDLNAVVIGHVLDEKIVRIKNGAEVVAEVETRALAEAPVYDMPSEKPSYLDKLNSLDINGIPQTEDYSGTLLRLLSSPSISSKRWVYEQYDHMVQTNTAVFPGSDAAVLRLRQSRKAIAITTDCNGRYCFLNPYRGAQIAVAEGCRNLVCSGAEPAALTDCLNFGNPEKPDRFWQFKSAVMGLSDACKCFGVSVVSGNVSFYNESPSGAIYPTPVVGVLGVIEDICRVCTQHFKGEGEVIVLLGTSREELGGSEYLAQIHNKVCGDAPFLDLELEKVLQEAVLEAIRAGLVSSAHDCSEGGLAVALTECCISFREKKTGAVIDNLRFDIRRDALLFGESQSRVILSCREASLKRIEEIAGRHSVPFRVIGKTGGERLLVSDGTEMLIDLGLDELSRRWEYSLKRSGDA